MPALENGLDLSGQVALVTGASRLRGIGAAICRALAGRGADVAFTHWRPYDEAFTWSGAPSEPDDLEHELAALGVRSAAIECDLSHPGAEVRLLDETESRLGPVRILVNNAAHSTNDGYERLDAATIDAHYAVNMRAAMLLSAEFARRFTAVEGGRIINLTSGQGLGPMPDELAYIATKGAIETFTRSLAPRTRPRGSRLTRSIRAHRQWLDHSAAARRSHAAVPDGTTRHAHGRRASGGVAGEPRTPAG